MISCKFTKDELYLIRAALKYLRNDESETAMQIKKVFYPEEDINNINNLIVSLRGTITGFLRSNID